MVRPRPGGFTIIELIVALAILAILVGLATPSFQRAIAQQRLRGVADEIRMALTLARSEAIKRNASVSILPQASGDWGAGWCVLSPGESTCSATSLLASGQDGKVAITALSQHTSAELSKIDFNLWGRTAGCPQFRLETQANGGTCRVCLYALPDGRVYTAAGACTGSCPSTLEDQNPWVTACD